MQRLCAIVVVLVLTGIVWGQEQPTPEQLKKMYDDALVQLKDAQDGKNKLAIENEKLKTKLLEVQKQAEEDQRRMADGFAEKTFFLRSQYAAFKEFLDRYPLLKERWQRFLKSPLLSTPPDVPEFMDPDWPLSAAG